MKCVLNSLLFSATVSKTFCELMRHVVVIMQDLQQADVCKYRYSVVVHVPPLMLKVYLTLSALSKTRLLPFRILLCLVQKSLYFVLLAKDLILIFLSQRSKGWLFLIPDLSLQFILPCVHILCSHWIGRSLDWIMMSVGGGIWPEIILRMDQAAQRF